VNSQIRSEALPIYYASHTFHINNDSTPDRQFYATHVLRPWLRAIGQPARKHLKTVQLNYVRHDGAKEAAIAIQWFRARLAMAGCSSRAGVLRMHVAATYRHRGDILGHSMWTSDPEKDIAEVRRVLGWQKGDETAWGPWQWLSE